MPKIPGQIRIAKRWSAYWQSIMDCWETYSFMIFAIEKVNIHLKKDTLGQFTLDHLSNKYLSNVKKRYYDKSSTFGITDRIIRKVNPVRALIEPVSLTEHYLQDITEIVYKDFPERILGKGSSGEESDKQQDKLLDIIIKSSDRDEIIDRICEEKIRNIFYGNPIDFYVKDKSNIGIGINLKSQYSQTMIQLAEIIARRNIYVHNNGRVDRKYLREVQNPAFKLDEIAILNLDYIQESIFILRGVAALTTKGLIQNTYGIACQSKQINDCTNTFDKFFKK